MASCATGLYGGITHCDVGASATNFLSLETVKKKPLYVFTGYSIEKRSLKRCAEGTYIRPMVRHALQFPG